MKIKEYQAEETLIIGAEKRSKFSIEENGVMFDILRDKMYSNKIGSIVREIASNSRDANRESGRADKAVSIIITEQYSEALADQYCIVFRDSGVGISPNRMDNVFIKYGASTKRSTDSQTGGFGLGAKTPFAYTDSFYIHTVAVDDEGTKKSYFYNALIDSSGGGDMVLLESEISNEMTGTDIIIPLVESSDRSQFANEAMFYTSLWGDSIDLRGVQQFSERSFTSDDDIINETESFILTKINYWSSSYESKIYALIDGIPYPIDTRKVESYIGEFDGGLDGHGLFLKFDIGEISVTATREGIEYDDATSEAINKKFRVFLSSAKRLFRKELKAMSPLECISGVISTFVKRQDLFSESLFAKTVSGLTLKLLHDSDKENSTILQEISYRGQTLQEIINMYGIGSGMNIGRDFEILQINQDKPEVYSTKGSKNLLKLKDRVIYIMDVRKDKRRNMTIFDEEESSSFVLIRPFGRLVDESLSEDQYRWFDKMVNEFNMDIRFYSEVEKKEIPKGTGGGYEPGATVSCRMRRVTSYSSSEGSSITIEVDRKSKDYTPFMKKGDYLYKVNSLSECTAPYELRQEMPSGNTIYLITERSHRLYLPDVKLYTHETLPEIVEEMKEKRFQDSLSDIDRDLLEQALTLRAQSHRVNRRRRGMAFESGYHTSPLVDVLTLGLYDDSIRRMLKIIYKTIPTPQLILFMAKKSGEILELERFIDRFDLPLREFREEVRVREISDKTLTTARESCSKLVLGMISSTYGNSNMSYKDLPEILEEIVTLKYYRNHEKTA